MRRKGEGLGRRGEVGGARHDVMPLHRSKPAIYGSTGKTTGPTRTPPTGQDVAAVNYSRKMGGSSATQSQL